MDSHAYHFITHWRIAGDVRAISDLLDDAMGLARWWPSVSLRVQVLTPGDERGIGRVVDLDTKGWLPYTLRWQFTVTDSRYPHGFTLQARGDFVGQGIWTLVEDGPWVHVTYDWTIRAEKPLLRRFSFLLRPIFSANHHWAMARGEESLSLEMARRRAASDEERGRVPPPPPPTAVSPVLLLTGIAVGAATATAPAFRRSQHR